MGETNQLLEKGDVVIKKLMMHLLPVLDEIWNLVLLNLLWIVFTLGGLVVFGIFPATVAVFAILRKWILKKETPNLFKEFWMYYKSEFKNANITGLFIWMFVYFFYIDWKFVQSVESPFSILGYILLLSLLLTFILIMLYLFPLVVHYNISYFKGIKTAILLALLNPLNTIFIIAVSFILYMVFSYIPALILFLGVSSFGWVCMKGSYTVFRKNEERLGN